MKKLIPWGSMEEEESLEGASDAGSVFAGLRELLTDVVKEGAEKATEVVKDQAKEVGAVLVETVTEEIVIKGMSAQGEVKAQSHDEEKVKKENIKVQNINTLVQSEQQFQIEKLKEQMEETERYEVAMPDDAKLVKLHLNTSMDAKNINDAYHLAELKRAQIEEIKQAIQEQQATEAQAVNPADPLNGHMIDTNAENQRLSNAVG